MILRLYTAPSEGTGAVRCVESETAQRAPLLQGKRTGDFAHRRDAHPRPCTDGPPTTQFLRSFAAPEGRRFQLSLNRDGPLVISARHARRSGGTGGRGEPRAQKHGAVCADRLAINRTAPASGSFISAVNPASIKRESQLRQSADWKKPAVGLWRPQILELIGWGATLFSSRVE